jgi:hypothetical protein
MSSSHRRRITSDELEKIARHFQAVASDLERQADEMRRASMDSVLAGDAMLRRGYRYACAFIAVVQREIFRATSKTQAPWDEPDARAAAPEE